MIKITINIRKPSELEIVAKVGLFHNKNTSSSTPDYKDGVYVLYKDGEVIKVGQSINVGNRLLSHDCNRQHTGMLTNKDWDSFSFIECDDDYTKFITEAVYTLLLKPIRSKIKYSL